MCADPSNDMSADEVLELEQYRIKTLPYGLYYIPNFITIEEERSILDKVI